MVSNKKIIGHIYAFFLIAFAHSVVFAMNSSKSHLYNELWQYAQSDQTLFDLKDLIRKRNVDIHSKNEANQTALHIAAMHGAESIVSYLLTLKKIAIDAQDMHGFTALYLAIRYNHLNLAKMLLEAKASLNIKSSQALHCAAAYVKDKEFIKYLINEYKKAQLDIDTSEPSFMNKTPLMVAVHFFNSPAIEALIEELFWEYAQSDQTFSRLKDFIEKSNVDINLRNKEERTILHIAAMHGAESIVSYLLDLKDDQLSKPSSSYENNLNNLRITIDAQDEDGYTALHFAIINRHLNLARMLIKAGAKLNVNKGNPWHKGSCWHALYFAAEYAEDKEFMKFIIEESQKNKFDINTLGDTDNGDTDDSDDFVIDTGVHLLANYIQKTPLMVASKAGNRAAVKALLEAGANITKQNREMSACALHYAAYVNDKKFVQLIIEESKKAQMNIDVLCGIYSSQYYEEEVYDTALILACSRLNRAAVEALLEAGASVHPASRDGQTALDIVLSYHYDDFNDNDDFDDIWEAKKIIRLLLESGANIYSLRQMNPSRTTPTTPLYDAVDLACKYHLTDVSVILTELLCWAIYQICSDSTSPENIAILQSIKNLYLVSPKFQALRQANPLLEWILTRLIDCTSKKQLLEKILQYLETADEEKQSVMIENIDSLLLKEDILKEFKLNLNAFKIRFSSVEKLKSAFRYVYAQKIEEEIFSNFSEDFSEQLNDLMPQKSDNQSFLDLKTAKDFMIQYCKNHSLESPLLKAFLTGNDSSQEKKMVDLAKCLGSNSNPDKTILVSEKAVFEVLGKRIDDVFEFIKEFKMHLDYIIEKEGACLKSNTQFGEKENTDQPKDILNF